MNKEYEVYLIDKWKKAEDIANKVGALDNNTVAIIFDKLASPYFYWKKDQR